MNMAASGCLLPRIRQFASVIALVSTPALAEAQGTVAADSAAVIAVAEAMLRAISTRDSASAGRLLLPGVQMVSVNPGGGIATQQRSEMLARIAGTKQQFLERMWNPTVRVHGRLATLETPYDFHIDGKFSHCGVDAFSMVKTTEGWKVASLTWNTQREGCAPSPLGLPR